MDSTPTIGVLSPVVGGFYFGGILSGVATAARAAGGSVLAVQTFDAGLEHAGTSTRFGQSGTDRGRRAGWMKPAQDAEQSAVTQLPGWDYIDGYVVVVNAIGPKHLRALVDSGKPVLLISNQTPGLGCPVVVPDNRGGVEEAVHHLIAHGHTKVAFVGCMAQTDMQERYEAYRAALAGRGLPVNPALFFETDDNVETGGEQAGVAMLAAGVPSTAVVAATDLNAIGMMSALTRGGLTLPRDQAVIGFDDTEAGRYANPRLSSLKQDFHEVGRTAGRLLLERLRGKAVSSTLYRIPAALVTRESCGCTPAGASQRADLEASAHDPTDELARALGVAVGAAAGRPASSEAPLERAVRAVVAAFGLPGNETVVDHSDLPEAIAALYRLRPSFETVDAIGATVRRYARELTAGQDDTSCARAYEVAAAVLGFVHHAQLHDNFEESGYFRRVLTTQYDVSMALLGAQAHDSRDLNWLARTGASAGSLGIWTTDDNNLEVVGAYDRADPAARPTAACVPLEQFPPQELLQLSRARDNEIVFALPVRAAGSDWGWLGIVSPVETRVHTGRETVNQWAALLTVALNVSAKNQEIETLSREMSVILESSPDAIVRYDAALRYRYLNPTAAAALGIEEVDAIGRTDAELGRAAEVVERWGDALNQVVSSVATTEVEFSETTADETRWYQARMVPLLGPDGLLVGVLASSRDLTALKHAEQTLAYQAVHDTLTGLANRVLFLDRLSQAIAQLERRPGSLAVLFIDLDHFKEVNDTLGHVVGDQLLVEVARRILAASRRADTLARFGGDEFVLLCDRLAANEDVRIVGERLIRTLAKPFYSGTQESHVSASIGIVVTSDPDVDVGVLVHNADEAMYTAKEQGRNRFHMFDEKLRQRATAQHDLEVDLRHALERQEFRLAYQPMFALADGSIVAAEALLRWHHPIRGVVPPAEFIGLAEQRGLIVTIGAWVLDEALRQLADWTAEPDMAALGVAVNLSGRQLSDPGIVTTVHEALTRHHIEPRRLTLEITETALIEDGGKVRNALTALRDLGVELALDDFGTGYSSLVHLRDFPVTSLKIDRSFVEQLGSGSRAPEIIGALIAMAHFLDMTVVGEGIEQQSEWDELRDLGCDHGQGFLFARPLAPAQLSALVKAPPDRPAIRPTG
jgi:diguanylate cyclase (GGDEF)-like protein/PAS domain S-box-containing protein